MREKDISRFAPAIDEDRVVVAVDVDLSERPRWDALETTVFTLRKRLVGVFQKACNALIVRMRAGRRLARIKGRIQDEGVKTREDAQRMVKEDWKTAQNVRLKEDEEEEDVRNV